MKNKKILKSLISMFILSIIINGCTSPSSPSEGLKKYSGTWVSERTGRELFSIDGDGKISSSYFSEGTPKEESENKFIIENAKSGVTTGNVTLTFDTDTTVTMYLDFTTIPETVRTHKGKKQ